MDKDNNPQGKRYEKNLGNHAMRALATNAMSQSLKMFAKRSYLSNLERIELEACRHSQVGTIHWVRICQVGKSLSSSVRQYFSTIQKILYSCHDPYKKQVVFLVKGDGRQISLYIGLRDLDSQNGDEETRYLANYIKNVWAGTQTEFVEDSKSEGPDKCLADKAYKRLYSITGIPSFTKNKGEEQLTAIDTLIGSLSRHKFAYVVFADPVNEEDVSNIIERCNEFACQLESVKSYNFQESENLSMADIFGESETDGTSTSKRDPKKQNIYKVGLGLAAAIGFAPALGGFNIPIISALVDLVKPLAESKNYGLSVMTLSGILGGGIPQESTNHSKTTTKQRSWTQGQSQTLSKTFVNRHASYALGLLDAQLARFEQGQGEGMWRTSAFLLACDDVVGRNATMQLKSIISGHNSHLEPVRVHNISGLKEEIKNCDYVIPDIFIKIKQHDSQSSGDGVLNNPFEGQSSTLSTLLTTEELSMLINFPQKSVPGLSVIEGTEALKLTPPNEVNDKPMIHLGKLLYSNAETLLDVSIPMETLAKHTLVAGVNGSGKTNTILGILKGLSQYNCPFLVLEPAKTEYVEWALKYNNQLAKDQQNNCRREETPIRIMMPGKSRYVMGGEEHPMVDELAFNPFEVISFKKDGPEETDILAHIDRIKSVFSTAFPMDEILPVVMEMLIYHIYTGRKLLTDIEGASISMISQKRYPTLEFMKGCIRGVVYDLEYEERVTKNITAALTTRVTSLLRGWKRDMLNIESSKNGFWQDLFNGKCVINLSGIGDDTDRSFIMSLILMFLYEYRIAESETKAGGFSFDSNGLRHMMVVEEAHRIMGHCSDTRAPQYKCGMMFSNMLSEIRAYGQGIMVVDQVPSRLIPDAVKNTNVKIVHRLVAGDDIEAMATSLGLDTQQQKIVPRLSTGQAIVSGIGSSDISDTADFDVYWCKINKSK